MQVKKAVAVQLDVCDYKTLKQVRSLFLIMVLNLPYFPKTNFLLKITITPLSEKLFEDILGGVKVFPKMFLARLPLLRHFCNL